MGGTRVKTNRSRLWLAGVLVATSSGMAQPLLVPDMSLVDAVDGDQPGGPSYPFHIGTFEFTNAEFVVFLNDALANLDNDRGAYMYFDTATGDVYVNGTATGGSGSGPGSLTVKMFAPSEPGRIAYGAGAFGVEVGYESHPVPGVSWYGALTCFTWLPLPAGFDPAQRCYPAPADAALASFLAGAGRQGRRFVTVGELFETASQGGLKSHPDDWLPPAILNRALRSAQRTGTWTLAARGGALPRLTCELEDGATLVGAFKMTKRRVKR